VENISLLHVVLQEILKNNPLIENTQQVDNDNFEVFIYLPIHSMKLISVQNYKKSLRYKQLFCRVVDKF